MLAESMASATPMLPPAPRWIRLLCGGLLALFVTELLLRLAGVPVDILAWFPFGNGFQPWQILTRYFVQGGDPGSVFRTLIGLVVIWLGLAQLDRKLAGQAAVAGMIGGTGLALLLDAAGILQAIPERGWNGILPALFVLWGLQRPDAQILAYFVLPISGKMLVWGSLAISALFFLSQQSLGTADAIGSWAGVYAWYHWIGPGSRKRKLRAKGRALEKELSRFKVIDGGKDDRGDPWVH